MLLRKFKFVSLKNPYQCLKASQIIFVQIKTYKQLKLGFKNLINYSKNQNLKTVN